MTVESGEFEIIKNSLACITDDRRLQALFIAFAFGSFIEGTAGFGTPVAITAAMLVGLGFQPVYAAGICLIANTAPVAFGAIGIPIVVAAGVTGLDMMHISQIVGRQLPFLSVIVPLWLVVTMSGWKSAMEVLPAIIVAGLCFAVSQFVVSNFVGPYLPDIISAIVTIVGLGIFLRFWKPATIWRFSGVAPTEQMTCQYSTGCSDPGLVTLWHPGHHGVFVGLGTGQSPPEAFGHHVRLAPAAQTGNQDGPHRGQKYPLSGDIQCQYRQRRGYCHLHRRAPVRPGPSQLWVWQGLCLPGADHQNLEMGHRHHFHDSRPGLHHELLRHELHPGAGLHRHRGAVSLLLTNSGLAGGVPDRAPTLLPMPCSAPCKRPPRSRSGWTPISWWRPTPAAG